MIPNYLKIAFRNIAKNKLFSFINIFGLAAGMSMSLLIILFVFYEMSYDRFHENYNRIFKTKGELTYEGKIINIENFSAATALAVKNDNVEVEESIRINPEDHILISNGNFEKFYEDKVLFADPSILSVFSFELLDGNPKTVLSKSNKMLLTPEMAKKYFGEVNPIGKILTIHSQSSSNLSAGKPLKILEETHNFEITGIIKPAPSNSTITYNFIISFNSLATIDKKAFAYETPSIGNYQHYFLLKNIQSKKNVENTLNKVIVKALIDMKQNILLVPIKDLHFYYNNKQSVFVFLSIALIILFLAIINYISLTTARSTMRSKEVGIRKVVGAKRKQLLIQFFGESLIFTLLSFLVSILFLQILLPVFYRLIQVQIPLHFIWKPGFLAIIILVLLLSSFLAGLYPAILISGFNPTETIKGNFITGKQGLNMRKIFFVFQFSVAIVLIICSIVIQTQIDFIRNKNIGLNKDNILIIPLSASIGEGYLSFKNELKKQTQVLNVATSSRIPFNPNGYNRLFSETTDKKQISFYFINVDEDFFKTYQIKWSQKLPEVNNFDKMRGKIILNEAAVAGMDLKNPLGKKIPFLRKSVEIAGVVKNFNFESLQSPIGALAISPMRDSSGQLLIKDGYLSILLSPNADLPQKIKDFAKIYKAYESEKPFEYFFLDETFNKLFKSEERLANIFNIFSFFAIFIACLGLLGLSTFSAARRTKEIGIRKVFGATISDIVFLISKEFIQLILISNIVAMPIAWYFMNKWIQGYPSRINLSWWMFAIAGILSLLIALLTVSFQAIKAAIANPVESLRSE